MEKKLLRWPFGPNNTLSRHNVPYFKKDAFTKSGVHKLRMTPIANAEVRVEAARSQTIK